MSEKLNKRETRKNRGFEAWGILSQLGMLQNKVAYKIHVHPAYFSKVINEEEKEAALSEEKLRELEDFVGEKIVAVVKEIFGLGRAHAEVISTGYAPSAPFTSKEEGLIKDNVVDSIASVLAGRPEPPTLPNGVRATTVCVDGGSHCEIYVIATEYDGEEAKQARIHEYDHLAAHFKDKANSLRGSGEPPELPKKGF